MRRRWDWTTQSQRSEAVRQAMRRLGLTRRRARTRPRDPDELRLLVLRSVAHIQRARAEGRWQKLDARRWRIEFR